MRESKFQAQLIQELKKMFPGCIVTKLDPDHIQGIPDLLILYKDKWASLECKQSANSEKMNEMSFSRFIYPENKEEVLYELQQSFSS